MFRTIFLSLLLSLNPLFAQAQVIQANSPSTRVFVYRAFERDLCPQSSACPDVNNELIAKLRSDGKIHRMHQSEVEMNSKNELAVPLEQAAIAAARQYNTGLRPSRMQFAIVIIEWTEIVESQQALAAIIAESQNLSPDDDDDSSYTIVIHSRKLDLRKQNRPFATKKALVPRAKIKFPRWSATSPIFFTRQSIKIDQLHLIDPDEEHVWNISRKGESIALRFFHQ